ncbi:MAG: molybdopterin-guanine dinucleotide biosynthesis protein A [Alphaproteobacteria bacterium]|jgi:molybdopterin-guanine dinucleotide biosynthesis protein A
MTNVIGIILAGGRSSRMGEDKAAMIFKDQSLLQNMITILSNTQVSKVVVNRNVTLAEPHSNSNLKHHKLSVIKDIIPDKGPLSGIHSALVNFPDANLLVVPVDIPLMSATSLTALITAANTHKTNCRFTPISANHIVNKSKPSALPLLIFNNNETRQALKYTLSQTDRYSVFQFCAQFPIVEVPLKNEAELTNLNYPWQLSNINLTS